MQNKNVQRFTLTLALHAKSPWVNFIPEVAEIQVGHVIPTERPSRRTEAWHILAKVPNVWVTPGLNLAGPE